MMKFNFKKFFLIIVRIILILSIFFLYYICYNVGFEVICCNIINGINYICNYLNMLINFVVNVVYTINYIFNCLIHSCIKFLSDIVNGISYICNYLDMVIDSCEKFLSNIINHQYSAYAIENSINNLQNSDKIVKNAEVIEENIKNANPEYDMRCATIFWILVIIFVVKCPHPPASRRFYE